MTNEAYTLMETNRDRAIVRRSARYKKGGSRSKKCTLGHEYKTEKELNKMNGECLSWKLTKFYTWEEFKEMPEDIQVEYINYLIDTYGIGLSSIEREVFDCAGGTLRNHLKKRGLINKIRERKAGGSTNRKNLVWFKQMIAEERNPKIEEAPKDEPVNGEVCDVYIPDPIMRNIEKVTKIEEEPVEIPKYEPIEQPFQQVSTMAFSTEYISNKIDRNMLDTIEHMFKGKKLRVSISVEAV